MATRTSHPSLCRAFGSAPITSPRPPVFAHGEHSDATTSTFSGGTGNRVRRRLDERSRGVDAVVEMGKDVVPGFDLVHPLLRHPTCLNVVVDAIEAEEVLVHAP